MLVLPRRHDEGPKGRGWTADGYHGSGGRRTLRCYDPAVSATTVSPDLFWYDEYETDRPLRSFVRTARRVLFQPRGFFERLDPEGSFLTALAFGSMYVGLYAALSTISSALVEVALHGATLAAPNVVGATLANIGASVLAVWLLMPIIAAVYHLFVRLLAGGSQRGYRATFRVLTYAGVADLVAWVPFVGLLLAGVWVLYVGTVGLRTLHATTLTRALLIVVLPTLLLATIGAIVALGLLVGLPPA